MSGAWACVRQELGEHDRWSGRDGGQLGRRCEWRPRSRECLSSIRMVSDGVVRVRSVHQVLQEGLVASEHVLSRAEAVDLAEGVMAAIAAGVSDLSMFFSSHTGWNMFFHGVLGPQCRLPVQSPRRARAFCRPVSRSVETVPGCQIRGRSVEAMWGAVPR